MPSNMFEAVDFRGMEVFNEPITSIPRFVEGELYSLQGIACDGFEMKTKTYRLIGVVDEYEGTEINSVIVKQVSGEVGKIFTLSKYDCDCLKIKYESGLQLFPKSLPWKLVKEEVPFNPYDLGTTPLSDIDNTVRHILIRLDGFKDYREGHIITPSGNIIKENVFIDSLKIKPKETIVYGNGVKIDDYKDLKIQVVYPKNLLYNHGNFISCEDTVYVLIILKKHSSTAMTDTIDGYFGVEKVYLDGLNPNEFFEISWDESSAKSIKEYKAEKERAIKEAEERVKQEEARKQMELESRKKEMARRKKEIDAIHRKWTTNGLMGYELRKPKINIFEDSVKSITDTVNAYELYFKDIEKNVNRQLADLEGFIECF